MPDVRDAEDALNLQTGDFAALLAPYLEIIHQRCHRRPRGPGRGRRPPGRRGDPARGSQNVYLRLLSRTALQRARRSGPGAWDNSVRRLHERETRRRRVRAAAVVLLADTSRGGGSLESEDGKAPARGQRLD